MKYIILFTLWTSWVKQDPSPEIWTEGGLVRGTTHKGGGYYQYLSIPYAFTDRKSRFQSAHGPPRWDGIYQAVNEHIRCPQRFSKTLVLGQENCLTLNVYTPRFMKKSLPVMVYFHGGGFREGGSSPFLYGPDYLVKKDVVFVSVNYRLEILGFLCLGIKEAPGNAGLKDQVTALKWVQENIANFGGNPNDVTIFGESAGASSVAYHLLSPMSKGLFHKAIMQSGTAITPWAFQYDPLKTASLLAEQMGFKTNDPYELYKIFNSKSAEELLRTRVPREEGTVIMSETIFVPCVEQPVPGVEAFLTDYPFQIFQTGIPNKVPMIIGYNSEEGYMFAGKENDTTISSFDFFKALPRDLEFPNDIEKRRIAESAREFYIGNTELDIVKLAKYHGEPFFKYPVLATTDILLRTQNQPVYSYRFSYDGCLNIAKYFFGFGKYPGATHADDIFYMFKTQFFSPWMFEKLMIEKITTLWTNFAKYGDPTPLVTSLLPKKWLPTRREKPVVFVIDRQFSTAPLWDTESMLFWNETYTKYRRKV